MQDSYIFVSFLTNLESHADWLWQSCNGDIKAWWQTTRWSWMWFSGFTLAIQNNFHPKCWFTSFISCLRFLYDIQCALLYTTITGERRIRVINLSLPCTSMLSNLFRSADLDSQFACMLKQGRCPCFWIYVFTCIYIYIFVFHASEYILVWYIVYWCFLFLCSG